MIIQSSEASFGVLYPDMEPLFHQRY